MVIYTHLQHLTVVGVTISLALETPTRHSPLPFLRITMAIENNDATQQQWHLKGGLMKRAADIAY